MKNYFLPAILLMMVFSCISPPEIPDDVLSKEKMVQIIIDIHYAESRVGQLSLRSMDSAYVLEKVYEQKVYEKYKTDSATYKRSFRFYSENAVYMEEIYNGVVDTLIAWEKRVSNDVPGALPPKENTDSLKNKLRRTLTPAP